jgi:hypothetical protein
MQKPYAVLEQKGTELVRIRHEIDCLRIIASLLADEPSPENVDSWSENSTERRSAHEPESKATGTEGPTRSDSRPRLWEILKRSR